jgi:hypothetical protein
MNTGFSIKKTYLSEDDLLKFNNVFVNDVELIATGLRLSQAEINRCKMENPNSISTVVHNILLMWKRKLASTATLENLEEALLAVEKDTGASVNWDVFSQAKKDILKKRKN